MQKVNPWRDADGPAEIPEKIGGDLNPGDLISAIFKDPSGEVARQWTLVRVQSRWPDMAGNLARHSWPERITGRRLVVRVSHDVYAQEFFLFRADIVRKLRAYGIREIDEIQVEKGSVKFTKPLLPAAQRPHLEASTAAEDVSPEMQDFLDKLKKI